MSSNPAPAHTIAASELRHQLRTPLNHIIGYSEILLEEYPEGAHRQSIQAVVREAAGMVDSVQQIVGGDHLGDPEEAIGELRGRLDSRIKTVIELLAKLKSSMPEGASADLDRIAAAARTLDRLLLDGSAAAMRAQVHPMDTPVEARPGPASGAGRILVVDDDEMNRDMLCRQLERQNHQVATAADGATALDMLRASRFDIVLLDLMMPGMNGFEVLERIRRDPGLSGVAVILVSALDEMDSVVRSIEAGAEDYLFKPVNPTLLRARIKSTLDKLRAEEHVRRKQRLESIGLLAAGVAHDFNNLLTGIIGHAQLLEYSLTDPVDREAVAAIISAGERAAELTRQLLAYSGKAMFHMKPVDLAAAIRDTEGLIHASLPRRVRLVLNLDAVPTIVADHNQLRQVLLNLVLNSAEAIGPDVSGS
ncbi:MAG: response regulator, partial [Acidobacteriota bacterium]|nr:response regulator [Acidobacteriota bacterium]